jgi:hypothetical protein
MDDINRPTKPILGVRSRNGSNHIRSMTGYAAAYQDTRWSARQIEPFVRKHHIDMARLTASSHRGVDERPGTVVRGGVAPPPSGT